MYCIKITCRMIPWKFYNHLIFTISEIPLKSLKYVCSGQHFADVAKCLWYLRYVREIDLRWIDETERFVNATAIRYGARLHHQISLLCPRSLTERGPFDRRPHTLSLPGVIITCMYVSSYSIYSKLMRFQTIFYEKY